MSKHVGACGARMNACHIMLFGVQACEAEAMVQGVWYINTCERRRRSSPSIPCDSDASHVFACRVGGV
jgi:hypothetical protein